MQDLNYSLRALAKARGFAFIATFTLAFGIGAFRGRLLTPEDCLEGVAPVAIISHSLVYGMEGLTAPPLLLAAAIFAFAAALAILIPAWRASKLDPLVALRTD